MRSLLPPDPYTALGVAKDASVATIKTAYRKLVLKCHPDKVADKALKAERQKEFSRIQEAYEVVSNEDKRATYDLEVRLERIRKEKDARSRPEVNPNPIRHEQRASAPAAAASTTTTASRYKERKSNPQIYHDDRFYARGYDTSSEPKSYLRSTCLDNDWVPNLDHTRAEIRKARERVERRDRTKIYTEAESLVDERVRYEREVRRRRDDARKQENEEAATRARHAAAMRRAIEDAKEYLMAARKLPRHFVTDFGTTSKVPASTMHNSQTRSQTSSPVSNKPPPEDIPGPGRSKKPTIVKEPHTTNDQSPSLARRNGLKVLVNGDRVDAFGDTGATHHIVDEQYVRKHNLNMTNNETELVMGNGEKLHSPGYVELVVKFASDTTLGTKLTAKVVEQFPFDLLLARPFFELTKTIKKLTSRFTRIIFPRLSRSVSINYLSGESSGSLFNAYFNGDTWFQAILDTGSNCNVIEEKWAKDHGLKVHIGEKHQGWISLPNGKEIRTTGRVYVDMKTVDGKVLPMELEVLQEAAVPVIIGVDAILDHDLFCSDDEALSERYNAGPVPELFHMDFRTTPAAKLPMIAKGVAWIRALRTKTSKSPSTITLSTGMTNRESEAERRWSWDQKFDGGKAASQVEWDQEHTKRFNYEKKLAGGRDPSLGVPLIREQPSNRIGPASP